MHTLPYECEFCRKKFGTKVNLDSHMFNHTNERKPFECSICQHGFLSNAALTVHYSTH